MIALLVLFFQQIIVQDIKVTICDKSPISWSYYLVSVDFKMCGREYCLHTMSAAVASNECLSIESGFPAYLLLYFFPLRFHGSRGVGLESAVCWELHARSYPMNGKKFGPFFLLTWDKAFNQTPPRSPFLKGISRGLSFIVILPLRLYLKEFSFFTRIGDTTLSVINYHSNYFN